MNYGSQLWVFGDYLPLFLARLLTKTKVTAFRWENLQIIFSFWAVRFDANQKKALLREYALYTKRVKLVKAALLIGYLEYDILFMATGDHDWLWQFVARLQDSLLRPVRELMKMRDMDEVTKLQIFAQSDFHHVHFAKRCLKVLEPGQILKIIEVICSAQRVPLPEEYRLAVLPLQLDRLSKARLNGHMTSAQLVEVMALLVGVPNLGNNLSSLLK